MYIERNKRKYKEKTAQETILQIRNILFGIDVFTYEIFWANPYNQLYSVRIETQGAFGTNGKGRNREYALASAYGEFLERLQNNLHTGKVALTRVLHQKIYETLGYYLYPDEKIISKEDFLKLPDLFLKNIEKEINGSVLDYSDIYFSRLEDNGFSGVLSVPFWDVQRGKIVYFPQNILHGLTGSNGMCAGNTCAEAIFQGICELLERYSSYLIYHNQITPPTISREFLRNFQEEYKIIENIEREGRFQVIIKDFSANIKLPCLASILIDKKNNKYRMNVGADTDFSVALSRTLTELFQGIEDEVHLDSVLLPIPKVEHDYFLNSDEESIQKRNNELIRFAVDGRGLFPKSLFAAKEDYLFDSNIFKSDKTYEVQVKELIHFIEALGFDVYIRDVSFLEFPSYQIYIPFLSTLGKKNNPTIANSVHSVAEVTVSIDKIEDLFFPYAELTYDKIKQIIQILELHPSQLMQAALKLNFKQSSDWSKVTTAYFLSIFSFFVKDYKKSLKFVEVFVRDMSLANNEYYQIVKDFIGMKIEKLEDSDIFNKLIAVYKKEIVEEVILDFSDSTQLLNAISIPKCPDCFICDLYEVCYTREILDLSIKFGIGAKKKNIQQSYLNKIMKP